MSHYEKQRDEEFHQSIATFKIRPNPETMLVWDELTQIPLKAKGEIKPRNEYWLRRITDGDVIEIKPKNKEA